MTAGHDAFLSHGTAAWRWRIVPAPPTVVELGVPHQRAGGPGIALHRHGTLRPGDVVAHGRFRSDLGGRTLLDLAARYEPSALLRALAEAEFQHDVRPDGSSCVRCAEGTRAARTSGRRFTPTRPGTARPGAGSSGASARCSCVTASGFPSATSGWDRGSSTASGPPGASSWSSTGDSTRGRIRPTPTTSATSGCAAIGMSSAATESARSPSSRPPWSPTSAPRLVRRSRSDTSPAFRALGRPVQCFRTQVRAPSRRSLAPPDRTQEACQGGALAPDARRSRWRAKRDRAVRR